MNRLRGGYFGLRNHWYELFEEQDIRVQQGVLHRWTGDPELLEGQYRYYPEKHKDKVAAEDWQYVTDKCKEALGYIAEARK